MQPKDTLIQKLRNNGHRLTQARLAILDLLYAYAKPATASDILKDLEKNKGLKVNKTTVYREIAFLLDHKVIEEVELQEGMKRYELAGDHHHHLRCMNCDDILDIDLGNDIHEYEKRIEEEKKFTVLAHSLEFFGLCEKCR